MFSEKTSLIIPTRNRPNYLRKTFNQIKNIKISFLEIIVIDSSDKKYENKIIELIKNNNTAYFNNNIKFFRSKPSTSLQRNIGIQKMSPINEFAMFLDDDIIFSENMFLEMNKTIVSNSENKNIIGFGFNQIQENKTNNFIEKIKNNFLFNLFQLYPSKPGKVALSGWHSKILNIKNDIFVDWIYTTACIYKSTQIKNLKFDDDFGDYGYLEDLDFSLNFFNSNKKILISSQAKYFHPLSIDRSSFEFGINEFKNRFKIVKKYNLSKSRFFVMTFLRAFIFFINIFLLRKKKFYRALGNIYGVINSYKY